MENGNWNYNRRDESQMSDAEKALIKQQVTKRIGEAWRCDHAEERRAEGSWKRAVTMDEVRAVLSYGRPVELQEKKLGVTVLMRGKVRGHAVCVSLDLSNSAVVTAYRLPWGSDHQQKRATVAEAYRLQKTAGEVLEARGLLR
jgi:hypothetical protein